MAAYEKTFFWSPNMWWMLVIDPDTDEAVWRPIGYNASSADKMILASAPPSDFDKVVADTWKGIKDDFLRKPSVDQSVREQVNSEIDHLVEKHEGGAKGRIR